MERKEKRRVSLLTIFICLALVVTMSVVVISGMNKTNALEDSVESRSKTGLITVKLDLTEQIEDEGLVEQEKIEEFLSGYVSNIALVDDNNNSVNTERTYVGSEKDSIGIYEINILKEAKYLRICSNEYEFLNGDTILEKKIASQKIYNFQELSEDIDEYNIISKKKETRVVTVKIDFKDYIEDKGITDQSEIDTLLENYSSRLTGRTENSGNDTNLYINQKVTYMGTENSTIGVYEVELTNDIEYIQMTKTFEMEYIELWMLQYDILYEGEPIEFVGKKNDYGYIYNIGQFSMGVYIQKILENVDEYNIKIEKKEEVTINVSKGIKKIDVLDNTNKVFYSYDTQEEGNKRKLKIYLSKRAEYDIVFAQNGNFNYYSVVYENDNKLDQKMVYTPSYNNEINNYYKTIKQGENKSEYNFEVIGIFESSILWKDNKNAKLQYKLRDINVFYGELFGRHVMDS